MLHNCDDGDDDKSVVSVFVRSWLARRLLWHTLSCREVGHRHHDDHHWYHNLITIIIGMMKVGRRVSSKVPMQKWSFLPPYYRSVYFNCYLFDLLLLLSFVWLLAPCHQSAPTPPQSTSPLFAPPWLLNTTTNIVLKVWVSTQKPSVYNHHHCHQYCLHATTPPNSSLLPLTPQHQSSFYHEKGNDKGTIIISVSPDNSKVLPKSTSSWSVDILLKRKLQ